MSASSSASFFFYDLETSGFDSKYARIMQFAGQRTDMDLQPIGEPVNILIKLTTDILPDPDAIFVTGITPQQTIQDGMTEVEFLKYFHEHVCTPQTTFLGFNTVRFDDEFMRCLLYRNFYDAYEWQWCDSCSRWDILDLVRMTRALRPEGIEWPMTDDGRPTNRLELLTKLNGLSHEHAHDALSDVVATISVAKLIRDKQPDLFKYAFEHRGKKEVKEMVLKGQPFVYTTGRYPGEFLHTSAAVLLAPHPGQDAALVYDLRYDPTDFISMTPEQLVECWRFSRDPEHRKLPVKTLKYNRCPAVAPLGVMNEEAQKRLSLPVMTIQKHLGILRANQSAFAEKVAAALAMLDQERADRYAKTADRPHVDGRLYDGFFDQTDKNTMRMIRAADPQELSTLEVKGDDRLGSLLVLYKARNYPELLTSEEREEWDRYRRLKLQSGGNDSALAKYGKRLQELAAKSDLTDDQRYLLEELQLYGQSIVQLDDFDDSGDDE